MDLDLDLDDLGFSSSLIFFFGDLGLGERLDLASLSLDTAFLFEDETAPSLLTSVAFLFKDLVDLGFSLMVSSYFSSSVKACRFCLIFLTWSLLLLPSAISK